MQWMALHTNGSSSLPPSLPPYLCLMYARVGNWRERERDGEEGQGGGAAAQTAKKFPLCPFN